MNNLVFLKPKGTYLEPYTTDEIIAECAGIQRTTVMRLIRKHEKDLEEFGIFGFEIRKLDGAGRPEKIYHFNEQQATLFITYLQNTPPVRQFKKDLVREFYPASIISWGRVKGTGNTAQFKAKNKKPRPGRKQKDPGRGKDINLSGL